MILDPEMMAQHNAAQHGTAEPSIFSIGQHSTAQHSTAQHGTAQHGTAQHSTTQHLRQWWQWLQHRLESVPARQGRRWGQLQHRLLQDCRSHCHLSQCLCQLANICQQIPVSALINPMSLQSWLQVLCKNCECDSGNMGSITVKLLMRNTLQVSA